MTPFLPFSFYIAEKGKYPRKSPKKLLPANILKFPKIEPKIEFIQTLKIRNTLTKVMFIDNSHL